MTPLRPPNDAILIGAGHNGLVAAAYLAKAGLKTLVLERREHLGGAAASQPIFPGYLVNTGAFDSGLFMNEIVRDLNLERHGLRFLHSPAILHACALDGSGVTLWRDQARTQVEIAGLSKADAGRYPAYAAWVTRLAGLLKEAALRIPPRVPHHTIGDLAPWLPLAFKARRMGRKHLMELVRVLPLSVQDFLDEWFEDPLLKAALGAAGVSGLTLGPRAPGTSLMLLYQAMDAGQYAGVDGPGSIRSSSFVAGGMGQLSEALAAVARHHGAEIRCRAEVSEIMLEDGQACGVRLTGAEELLARIVLSNADPRRSFFDLVGAAHLEVRHVREVRNIRFRGSTARVNLALSRLPAFPSAGKEHPAARLSGHILLCPSLEYLEQAYDDAKYGKISTNPCIDMVIPTLMDASLAPAGRHVLCANVQYAPYHLKESNWDAQREILLERTLETLENYAPGIRQLVLHQQVLTPLDLEREYGLTEGCLTHGQMALDQVFFMRPMAGFGQYRTPLPNLYLCGAGTHPGGGVTGIPGRNAARVALKDFSAGRSKQ